MPGKQLVNEATSFAVHYFLLNGCSIFSLKLGAHSKTRQIQDIDFDGV